MVKLSLIAVVALSILSGCPWRTGPDSTIRQAGYWPLRTPDDGLLTTGTIAYIKRDNPVEFNLLCSAADWGVTGAPVSANGLHALTMKKEFTAKINADIKQKVPAEIGAKFKNRNVVELSNVSLEERYEADVDGDEASAKCLKKVKAYQKRNLDVSVVTGNFRATIEFSAELSGELGAKAEVKDTVNAELGFAASKSLEGAGKNLIWGIKYINLSLLP